MAVPRIAMIRVQNLDEQLRRLNGEHMHLTGEYAATVKRAQLGEKKGKWKILSGIDGGEYKTREIVAGGSGAYLTRGSFAMSLKDFKGEK